MNGLKKKFRSALTVMIVAFGLIFSATSYAADDRSYQPFDKTHGTYSQLLKDNVKEGMVNYAALVAANDGSRSILLPYLKSLAEVERDDFDRWGISDQLAFLLNLYNAATLQLIVDNYPVDSIKDIGWWANNAWKKKIISFFGIDISLDDLEHDIIRVQFKEPRIHFALVCAAKGCPELRSEAYVGQNLGTQFNQQARTFLADSNKNRFDRVSGEVYLSNIFRWYGDDFAKDNPGLLTALRTYWPEEVQAQLRQHKLSAIEVSYSDYDWSLNEMEKASLPNR